MKVKLVDQITGPQRNSWLSCLLVTLMTDHTPNGEKWNDVFGIKIAPGSVENDVVELKIALNGVEVRFEEFIKHLEETHNQMLEEVAKELISKRCQKLLNVIEESERLINDEIEQDFPGRKVW